MPVFSLLMLLSTLNLYPQTIEPGAESEFVVVHTGLSLVFTPTSDGQGSRGIHMITGKGIRTFVEYQRQVIGNLFYGVSYEGMLPFPYSNIVSLSGYYRLKLYRDRVFLMPGLGIGGIHHFDSDYRVHRFGVAGSGSITINVRITTRLFLEFAPLIVHPTRSYVSLLNFELGHEFMLVPILNFGVRVKI